MDLANLQIKVDSSQVPKGTSSLAGLEAQARKTDAAVDKMGKSTRTTGAGMQSAATQGRAMSAAMQNVAAANNVALSSSQRLNASFSNLLVQLRGLQIGYAAVQITKAADNMLLYKARIDLATDSVQDADEAWAGLLETAKDTGSLQTGIEIFSRISLSKADIKATNDEMLQFTDTVQKLGIVSGASGDAMKFGLTQLGQSLSSDIVRAEEFNSIMENIPAVGKSIADQFGISTGQLRKMVIEGQVLSKDVFAAILNATDQANAKFEKMPMTAGRAFNELLIRIMEIINGFNEASNATAIIVGGIEAIGDALSAIVNVVNGYINVFKGLFDTIVGGIMTAIQAAIQAVQTLTNVGISVINFFKKDDIEKVNWTGGLTYRDVSDATTESTAGKFGAAGKNFKNAVDDTLGIFGLADKDFKTADKVEVKTREISQNYKDMAINAGEANKEAEKHAKQVAKTVADLQFRNEQFGRTIEDQELYNQLRQANVDIDSEAGQKIAVLVDEYNQLKKEQEELNTIVNTGESVFKKLWKGAMDGATDWRDVMRSVIDDVSEMFYDLAIKSPLQDLMKQMMGGGGSSGGGLGGILGSLAGGLGGFFGGGSFGSKTLAAAMTPKPSFAEGGSFRVGGQGGTDSQLVQFMASPNETVNISRPDQQGKSGGGGNHFVVDMRGASVEAVQRLETMVKNMNGTLEKRALNAVDNRFKRDPTFGKRN